MARALRSGAAGETGVDSPACNKDRQFIDMAAVVLSVAALKEKVDHPVPSKPLRLAPLATRPIAGGARRPARRRGEERTSHNSQLGHWRSPVSLRNFMARRVPTRLGVGVDYLIWTARNLLKYLESDEGMQKESKPIFMVWLGLALVRLGGIWPEATDGVGRSCGRGPARTRGVTICPESRQ